jgi:2-phospho-L-lactate transferase/gluconeogenesis factor (CofD/UPF0052 family)
MAAQGLPVSLAGLVQAYGEFLDILVADTADAKGVAELQRPDLRVVCANTIMRTAEDKADLARAVLSFLTDQNAAHAADQP